MLQQRAKPFLALLDRGFCPLSIVDFCGNAVPFENIAALVKKRNRAMEEPAEFSIHSLANACLALKERRGVERDAPLLQMDREVCGMKGIHPADPGNIAL